MHSGVCGDSQRGVEAAADTHGCNHECAQCTALTPLLTGWDLLLKAFLTEFRAHEPVELHIVTHAFGANQVCSRVGDTILAGGSLWAV